MIAPSLRAGVILFQVSLQTAFALRVGVFCFLPGFLSKA